MSHNIKERTADIGAVHSCVAQCIKSTEHGRKCLHGKEGGDDACGHAIEKCLKLIVGISGQVEAAEENQKPERPESSVCGKNHTDHHGKPETGKDPGFSGLWK